MELLNFELSVPLTPLVLTVVSGTFTEGDGGGLLILFIESNANPADVIKEVGLPDVFKY